MDEQELSNMDFFKEMSVIVSDALYVGVCVLSGVLSFFFISSLKRDFNLCESNR